MRDMMRTVKDKKRGNNDMVAGVESAGEGDVEGASTYGVDVIKKTAIMTAANCAPTKSCDEVRLIIIYTL